MKILIVTAHPDDIETGASGLAYQMADAQHELFSVVATSARSGKEYRGRPLAEVREEESTAAHHWLGITPDFLRYETGYLYDDEETRTKFSEVFRSINPDVVFTLWPVDAHPDHRAVASLTMNHFLQKECDTELFLFEVRAGSTTPYPQSLHFVPTHYVNISEALKHAMLSHHVSQNAEQLFQSNFKLWKCRAEELKNKGRGENVDLAEAYIRLTRTPKLHTELEEFFIPTPYNLPTAGLL